MFLIYKVKIDKIFFKIHLSLNMASKKSPLKKAQKDGLLSLHMMPFSFLPLVSGWGSILVRRAEPSQACMCLNIGTSTCQLHNPDKVV